MVSLINKKQCNLTGEFGMHGGDATRERLEVACCKALVAKELVTCNQK